MLAAHHIKAAIIITAVFATCIRNCTKSNYLMLWAAGIDNSYARAPILCFITLSKQAECSSMCLLLPPEAAAAAAAHLPERWHLMCLPFPPCLADPGNTSLMPP